MHGLAARRANILRGVQRVPLEAVEMEDVAPVTVQNNVFGVKNVHAQATALSIVLV